MSLFRVVLRPRGRSWAVAGGLPNQGRQRPLSIYIHRDDNRRLCSMTCFAVRGKGAISTAIEGVIVVVLAVSVVSTTGQVRYLEVRV